LIGLASSYDTEQGRKQLRASILCAREFLCDVLKGRIDADDPVRTVMKLNERVFRFAARDRNARELYRSRGVDPAHALVDDDRLPLAFRSKRLPQMRIELGNRERLVPGA
jgi:hypothetical protein